ncbi:substrate-binding domain-containing protein [Occultella gossypii]|uniref:Substrate-binding domain-containing protein n=1 Tax=Occultella gossypii TaxID=2800820 RepID=A0ABS7SC44_9MICO|nr:substrate-binding domain-containing protein [Occultella gossypii]MBZ2197929.1 substrate-binding domain-containing protein [Occultella gossypii]
MSDPTYSQSRRSSARSVGIKDVAAAAGVSWKTVTNVIHGRPNVGPATRRRVEQAIEDLGYRANLAGRQLRHGRTGLLAVSVPDLATPYFADLARSIVQRAREDDYTVLIDETGHSVVRETAAARGYAVRFTDGVMLSPSRLTGVEVAALRSDTPVLLLGEQPESGGLDHVSIDNGASAREATRHMLMLGRRRLAFLGAEIGPNHRRASSLRIAGIEQARAAERDRPELTLIETSEFSRSEGFARTRMAFESDARPDALLCATDLLAVGALHALASLGLRVPDDVAVLGWDNAPEGEYSWPPLTTIAPDMADFATQALKLLIARIAEPEAPPRRAVVQHRLVVRSSTLGTAAAFNPAVPYQIRYEEPSPATLIRDARIRAGMTQAALAKAAGTSQAMIARYEAETVSPTVPSLRRILRALGTDLHLDVTPTPE